MGTFQFAARLYLRHSNPILPTQTTFFSFSDIHYSDWDPTPAVPGDSQQESNFLPPVSTQKFWKARPEQFQRPGTKNTFVKASPQVALVTWWDARVCHYSAEELGNPAEHCRMQRHTANRWEDMGMSRHKGNSHQTYGERSSPRECCSFRTGLERW